MIGKLEWSNYYKLKRRNYQPRLPSKSFWLAFLKLLLLVSKLTNTKASYRGASLQPARSLRITGRGLKTQPKQCGVGGNRQGGSVRDLLAPNSAISWELLGLLRLAFGQALAPPYKLLRLVVSSSLYKAITILFTILFSFINSFMTYTQLTYSLLYTWANMPYKKR